MSIFIHNAKAKPTAVHRELIVHSIGTQQVHASIAAFDFRPTRCARLFGIWQVSSLQPKLLRIQRLTISLSKFEGLPGTHYFLSFFPSERVGFSFVGVSREMKTRCTLDGTHPWCRGEEGVEKR